jgi:hypothetical protein
MSTFSDAITQSMIAGLDPMNGIVKDYASEQAKQLKQNRIGDKAKLISEVGNLLQSAVDKQQDGRIVAAFDRLLTEVTS